MTVMSCGTETLNGGTSGSPLTMEAVPAVRPPTRQAHATSSPAAQPAPASPPAVVDEPADVFASSVGPVTSTTAAPPPVFASPIEVWRPHVAVWFRPEHVDLVLALIECESSGRWDAENPTPAGNGMTAKGLLQHLDGYWPTRATKAAAGGYRNGGDIFDPIDQLAVSAWLAYQTPQGFGHWECHQGEAA